MGHTKTRTFDPFDLEDRLDRAEKIYPDWIIVVIENNKIAAYHRESGQRLKFPYTVGGFTALENKIEELNVIL